MSPAVLDDTGDTDDQQEDDLEEGASLGNDEDDAEAGWDEENKRIDAKVTDYDKSIPVHLLDRDLQMKLDHIRSRNPRMWKTHQESFAMTPPEKHPFPCW